MSPGGICLVKLDAGERHGYVLGSRAAGEAYSPYLDLGYNRQIFGWRDETPHMHTNSEEYFVVLKGRIDLRVGGRVIPVEAGHLLGVRAGIPHQIVNVCSPVENFLVRVPGGGDDKVVLKEGERNPTGSGDRDIIQLDLHQEHNDYLLGACLPESHPNYSPLLDFNCVFGVDPFEDWKNEQLHYHHLREEYYILLRGRLDFRIGEAIVPVCAGEILGVKPETAHMVTGGEGPVDLLFVRVPGGRGDKVVV